MVIWDFRSQLENLAPVVKVVIGGKEVFHTVRLSAQLLELCACVLHIMQSASQLYSCSCGHQIVKNSCLTACLALSCFSKPTRQIWPARWEAAPSRPGPSAASGRDLPGRRRLLVPRHTERRDSPSPRPTGKASQPRADGRLCPEGEQPTAGRELHPSPAPERVRWGSGTRL